MATSLFNHITHSYRISTVKEIRETYFEGMSQHTFVSLFSALHLSEMKAIGFRGFRGYQNSEVVKYMVESVGRIEESRVIKGK